MRKESAAYAEHVLDLLTEVLHKTVIMRPLREVDKELTLALAQGLQFLFQHEACYVRDIAKGLSTTYSAASQLMDRLVKKGLASRQENERDRRLSEIRLTEKGRELVEQVRLHRVMGMSRILQRMSPDCRKLLIENMENFITAAIQDDKSALETCSHCGKDHLADCVINEVYLAATGMPIKQF